MKHKFIFTGKFDAEGKPIIDIKHTTSAIASPEPAGPLPVVDAVAGGSAEEEVMRLKARRLRVESRIASARRDLISAELDLRVINHCIKALSPNNSGLPRSGERGTGQSGD